MKRILIIAFVLLSTLGYSQSEKNFTVRNKLTVVNEFELADSSAIAIVTDGDTIATVPWVRNNAMPWDSLDFQQPYNNGYLRWYREGVLDSTSLDGRYPTITANDSNLAGKATQFPGICAMTPIGSDDISINYTTRVLTITPPLGYFDYFTDGSGVIEKHTVTGAVSFPAFTDVSGIWYFYFDASGTAITTQTAWSDFSAIATVYRLLWNATETGAAKSIVEAIETHENTIPWVDHMWKHRYGAIWFVGFDNFNNFLASGTPAANGVNTVVSFNSGVNLDDNLVYTVTNSTGGLDWEQDLGNTTPASLDNTNAALMTIKYRDAIGLIYELPATRYPFAWDTGTDIPEYIDTDGVRNLVSNGDFFVYFVYSIQDPRNGEGLTLISAPEEFATITGARAYNWSDLQGDFPLVNDGEVRPLYKFIHEYKTTFGVTNKYSALREVTDIRKQEVTQGGTLSGTIAASQVTNIPSGNIGSTNQQAVNNELDLEKIAYADTKITTDTVIVNDNIGIGTSDPTDLLHVYADVLTTGTKGITIQSGSTTGIGEMILNFKYATGTSLGSISQKNAAPYTMTWKNSQEADLSIESIANVTIDIDKDNDAGDRYFKVTSQAKANELFVVEELGDIYLGNVAKTQENVYEQLFLNYAGDYTGTLARPTLAISEFGTGFHKPDADNFVFGINAVEAMRLTENNVTIDSSLYVGVKVGIGTISPTTTLDINGDLSFAATLTDKISLFDDRIGLATMYGFGAESGYTYSKAVTGHRWYLNTNADAGVSSYMTLITTGLGINTDTPNYKLDVNGTGRFSGNLILDSDFGFSTAGVTNIDRVLDENDMTSNSATALATQQSIKAYVDSSKAFAEIYVYDASTGQSITNGTTYVKVTAFTTDGEEFNSTADVSNDKITITKTGKYRITHTSDVTYAENIGGGDWGIFVDGTIVNNLKREFSSVNTTLTVINGFVDITSVPVDVDVRIRTDAPGAELITVHNANLTVEYLGD